MQLLAQHPTLPPWEALLFVESRSLPYPGENTRNCLFSSVLFKKLYLGLGEPRVGEALGSTEGVSFLSVWREFTNLGLQIWMLMMFEDFILNFSRFEWEL